MSADRELLEAAAKAVGMLDMRWSEVTHDLFDELDHPWNPLEDDGDALRLAVDMNLVIEIQKETGSVWVSDNGEGQLENPAPDADWHAATRRAIVRAAAAIGGGVNE